jgi:hypothetical protein
MGDWDWGIMVEAFDDRCKDTATMDTATSFNVYHWNDHPEVENTTGPVIERWVLPTYFDAMQFARAKAQELGLRIVCWEICKRFPAPDDRDQP